MYMARLTLCAFTLPTYKSFGLKDFIVIVNMLVALRIFSLELQSMTCTNRQNWDLLLGKGFAIVKLSRTAVTSSSVRLKVWMKLVVSSCYYYYWFSKPSIFKKVSSLGCFSLLYLPLEGIWFVSWENSKSWIEGGWRTETRYEWYDGMICFAMTWNERYTFFMKLTTIERVLMGSIDERRHLTKAVVLIESFVPWRKSVVQIFFSWFPIGFQTLFKTKLT